MSSWPEFLSLPQVLSSFLSSLTQNFFAGDMFQLPPIYDRNVMDNNTLDGRPDFAPRHCKENFSVYFLTEKMRSMRDPEFSAICDRVAVGKLSEQDKEFLKSRVKETEAECSNENFKSGKLLYIVTTNKKRNFINNKKLKELLPMEKEYVCNSIDNVKNLPYNSKIPNTVNNNPSRTGNLMKEIKLKVNAPIVITTNHSKKKDREDGIMNGARGFVQAVQVSKSDP